MTIWAKDGTTSADDGATIDALGERRDGTEHDWAKLRRPSCTVRCGVELALSVTTVAVGVAEVRAIGTGTDFTRHPLSLYPPSTLPIGTGGEELLFVAIGTATV